MLARLMMGLHTPASGLLLLDGLDRASLGDETFGALDPDTLRVCMKAVRERAPTLVVIAHP